MASTIEASTSAGAVGKGKRALGQNSAKKIRNMGTMRKNENKARLAMQIDEVRERALMAQVWNIKSAVRLESEVIHNASRAT